MHDIKLHFRSQYFEIALKFEFGTKSGCTRIWVCHVTGVSIRRNVKWLENALEFGMMHIPSYDKSPSMTFCTEIWTLSYAEQKHRRTC